MKTSNELSVTTNGEEQKKDGIKANNSSAFTETNSSNAPFGILDLWRMQKKHKTLGSSIRWQPL